MANPTSDNAATDDRGEARTAELGGLQREHSKGSLLRRWLLMLAATRDQRLSRSDCAALGAVLARMNAEGAAWPGMTSIAHDAGIDRRTAVRAIGRLSDAGYLLRDSGRPGLSNRYRIGSDKPAASDQSAPSDELATSGQTVPRGEFVTQVGANLSQGRGELAPRTRFRTRSMNSVGDRASRSTTNQRGTRISETWLPDEKLKCYARTKLAGIECNLDDLIENFRDHWIAATTNSAVKRDWSAAFRFWVRNELKFTGQRRSKPAVGRIRRDVRSDAEIAAANAAELARFNLGATP